MNTRGKIIWLTGNSGAGKTTLSHGLINHYLQPQNQSFPYSGKIVSLDGDEMRATISLDEGFSPEDRRKHNLRVARLANLIADQGFLVVVSVIAPFDSVRDELGAICNPRWVYIKREGLEANDRPYEPPAHPDCTIDNDALTIEEALDSFIQYAENLVSVAVV